MELFNIKFVGEVEKHPEIYNYTIQEYSRKDCLEKAWNEVAKEVQLSVSECKEKWRNLRSTFAKKLRPKPSGSGATSKRKYYLADAMQFAIPFIKVARMTSGHLPEIQATEPDMSQDDTLYSEDNLDSQVSVTERSDTPLSLQSMPASPRPLATPPQPGPSAASQENNETVPDTLGGAFQGLRGQPNRKRKRSGKQSEVADTAFAEYFSAKAAKMAKTSQVDERREGIQNFLNSLIPDLMQMNDVNLRVFKRKALLLIDEVNGTFPPIYFPSNTDVASSSYQGPTGTTMEPPN